MCRSLTGFDAWFPVPQFLRRGAFPIHRPKSKGVRTTLHGRAHEDVQMDPHSGPSASPCQRVLLVAFVGYGSGPLRAALSAPRRPACTPETLDLSDPHDYTPRDSAQLVIIIVRA